jgi:small nuclear ribonucleoprotein (snRNP)-like protein
MLAAYQAKRVSVVTRDGRHLLGVLESSDAQMNVVMSSATERVYFPDAEPIVSNVGAIMLRGVNVVCVSLVNTVEEAAISVPNLRGPPAA